MLNCSPVTTVYPVEEFGRESVVFEDTIVETLGEIIPPTQSFSSTVAAIQNSLESLHELDTPTLLPFTPSIVPEVTPAAAETPSQGLLEHTQEGAEETADVMLTLQTITLRPHEGNAEQEKHLIFGKTPSISLAWLNQDVAIQSR